jgi:hypothetical protein
VPANAFEFFLQRENARRVDLLEKNLDVSEAMISMLDALVAYSNARGVPFEHLEIVGPDCFSHDDYVRFGFRIRRDRL